MRLFKVSRTYLDWASAAPVHAHACAVFTHALSSFGNPSSPHTEGREAKDVLENARTRIARLAGVKPRAVIFTSGATEANNLVIQGRLATCRAQGMKRMHVLYLPTMHSSVIKTLITLTPDIELEEIPLTNGLIDLATFSSLIRPETILVCVDAVCGETGTRFDTLRVRRALDTTVAKDRALLLVDASQLPLVESIERTRLGADMLTLDAQKVGGVRGIGALIIPHHKNISPIMQGGGQESGLRPGTEPVALAAAFAAVLEVRSEGYTAFTMRARKERVMLISELALRIPEAVVNEASQHAPHILNISLPGFDTDYVITLLDTDGYAVSTRSACETDTDTPSAAVRRLTNDAPRAASTLRISWGPETPPNALQRFIPALRNITTFLARA